VLWLVGHWSNELPTDLLGPVWLTWLAPIVARHPSGMHRSSCQLASLVLMYGVIRTPFPDTLCTYGGRGSIAFNDLCLLVTTSGGIDKAYGDALYRLLLSIGRRSFGIVSCVSWNIVVPNLDCHSGNGFRGFEGEERCW
jgi:hypothetical protein